MKILLFILLSILGIDCDNPINAGQDYIYYYNWTNPTQFTDQQIGGGDGLWYNTVRNHVLNASAWTAIDGFVELRPFSGDGSYSVLILKKSGDTANVSFGFTLTANIEPGNSGIMKVNAYGSGDSETSPAFTNLQTINFSTVGSSTIQYTFPLPNQWTTLSIEIRANGSALTPYLLVTNTFIK